MCACVCVCACVSPGIWIMHAPKKCLKGLPLPPWEQLTQIGLDNQCFLYYEMFTFLILLFFSIKKKEKLLLIKLTTYTARILKNYHKPISAPSLALPAQHLSSWIPHDSWQEESHLTPSDSNTNRAIFHSWWGYENEFDEVFVLNFLAFKLPPIYLFKLNFILGKKMYWSAPDIPSGLPNHQVKQSVICQQLELQYPCYASLLNRLEVFSYSSLTSHNNYFYKH